MKKSIVVFVVLMLGIGLLYYRFPYALKSSDSKADLAYFLVLATALTISLSNSRIQASVLIKNAIIWISIILILLIGYSHKDDVLSLLVPNRPVILKDGSFMITVSKDKHFHVEAQMNNQIIDCVIDTGASSIVIDTDDARAIGVNVDQLKYNMPAETANGMIYSAPAKIAYLRIGDIELEDTVIMVNKVEMSSCLLGMSFLNTFKKISIEHDKMLISPQ